MPESLKIDSPVATVGLLDSRLGSVLLRSTAYIHVGVRGNDGVENALAGMTVWRTPSRG